MDMMGISYPAKKSDGDYFRDIVRGVIDNIDTIDNSIKK